jgi:hypothetical protein
MATRPIEYYQLYHERIEHEERLMHQRLTRFLCVEAALYVIATVACGCAWVALARQADIVTYNAHWGLILVPNAWVFNCCVGLDIAVCYIGGCKLIKEALVGLEATLGVWHSLVDEGGKVRSLWESQGRCAEDAFPIPAFGARTGPDQLLVAPLELNGVKRLCGVARLMWLFLFVIAVGCALLEIGVIWVALYGPRLFVV